MPIKALYLTLTSIATISSSTDEKQRKKQYNTQ